MLGLIAVMQQEKENAAVAQQQPKPFSAPTQEKHRVPSNVTQLQGCTIDWDALDLDAIEAAAIKSCVPPINQSTLLLQPVPAALPLLPAHHPHPPPPPKEHSNLKRPRRPCPDSGPGVPGVDFPHEETLNQTRAYFLEGGYDEKEVDEILVQKGLISYHCTAAGKREYEEKKKKWQRRSMCF